MAVKLLRDQIRQRHHPERGDIPHHTIDPFREVPARLRRVILPAMAMAVRVSIAAPRHDLEQAAPARYHDRYSWVTDRAELEVWWPPYTDVLTDAGIHISMDGKGRWMDNVFIERLWRSLKSKYEQVYLAEYATTSDARAGIGWWIDFYNERRPHSSLVDRTPNEAVHSGGYSGTGALPRPNHSPRRPDL